MKIYGIIRTALCLALSALVIAFVPSLSEIETLRYFTGGLLIFYGAEEIIYTVFKNEKHYSINSLYWNLVEIIIGLTLIVFVETDDIEVTYAVVCVVWAIWSILRESRELVEATEELKNNKLIACKIIKILSLLESLTIIAISLTLIITPGQHHAEIHLYFLSVELVTRVLFPILTYIAERAHEKKANCDTVPIVMDKQNSATDEEVAITENEEQSSNVTDNDTV